MTTVPVTAQQVTGDLAARQSALVAALVAGGELPAGFDHALVCAARRALLLKRAAEVARAWPLLAASLGADWPECFIEWAGSRPPRGPQRDGRDFAREWRSVRARQRRRAAESTSITMTRSPSSSSSPTNPA